MTYTDAAWFRNSCRVVLFCFTFALFHPSSLRAPWTLHFAHWTLEFGPTPAYGKAQDPPPVAAPGAPSREVGKADLSVPSTSMVRLPGHVLPALAKAKAAPRSKAAADEPLTLTLVLKRDDQAGFDKYLRDVYDPKSPIYRKFLTPGELSERFGPSREAYDDVLSYLQEHGFTLVEGSANRLTLTVQGARTGVENTFALHISDYKIGDRTFYANDRDPAFPKTLSSHIMAISGLSNLAEPGRATAEDFKLACTIITSAESGLSAAAIVAGVIGIAPPIGLGAALLGVLVGAALSFLCLSATDMLHALGESPYDHPAGAPDGTGQTIGLLQFDTFRAGDIEDYIDLINQARGTVGPIGNLSQVPVNGGVATPGPGSVEVLLDIAAAMRIAPGANVVVYHAPFSGQATSYATLFNAMIDDGVDIISNSWSSCESQVTLADVQGIDAVLQSAAASGISVFNASGDTGSTCLDGSPNTVGVPSGSPHATAVGGTSLTMGPGFTYGSETWWDGEQSTPPTGQGGFGVSRFFARPAYQDGLNLLPMRSVPDVVAVADPATTSTVLCQADGGGCPTGLSYGGTSLAAPIWAAFTALLNQARGQNLGFLNPLIYPLAGTDAFHDAVSMSSDFSHVGLGSPNLNILDRLLSGMPVGSPDATQSQVEALVLSPLNKTYVVFDTDGTAEDVGVPADGTSRMGVLVRVMDANGHTVSGKTVTLVPNGGSAVVTPANGVTTVSNGSVVFEVTDLIPETVTFTAVVDGVVLDQQAHVTFVTPPAASASIAASPTTVTANGVATTTIAVVLKDALNRPTPGKHVTLSQGNGHSLITGPNPSVTDSNGQIQFTATNLVNEVVTYTAVDVTDGNLPVPGSAVVTFNNGSGGACGQNTPPAVGLNGYTVTPFATGFATGPLFYGNINFGGCSGVAPLGFLDGNAYIPNFLNGDLFKLGLGGGVVSNANKLSTIAPTLGWVVTGKDGKLYATRTAVDPFPPNFTNGAVVELDPVTGAVTRTLAANLPCSQGLVVDPLSGDLFFDGQCFGAGSNNPNLFRIRNPGSATPTLEVYATLPASPNGQIAFAPNGTIYVVVNYLLANPPVYRVSGTDIPGPPAVTLLPGVVSNYWLNVGNVDATGEATELITLNVENNVGRLKLTDITTTPPTVTATMTEGTGGGTIGPDGCLYMPNANVMYKLTDPTGGCSFIPTNAAPSLTLTPTVVSPDPAQGSEQTFTATFRNVDVPADTPVFFAVTGANSRFQLVRTNANGEALLTYTAINEGTDTIVATATVDDTALTSNEAKVTWAAGKHTTFLTLNPSPKGGTPGVPVNVIASLTDVSLDPPAPVVGETINFTLDGVQCSDVTDAAGLATCQLVPSTAGVRALTATFAGSSQLVESMDAVGFNVLAAPSGGIEICGNCTDEDGDSLPDLLDPDCITLSLTLKKGVLVPAPTPNADKLTLQGTFTAAPGSLDPPARGVAISLVDEDGPITCLTLPPGQGWKTNKARTLWRFMDQKDDSLGDPEAAERFRLKYNVRTGVFTVQVKIKEAELMDAEAGQIHTGISIGGPTFMNVQTWRSTAKGKKLTTP